MFKNPYDFKNHKKKYEVNNMPSKTIPDQSMSIPELIKRYASGLPLGGQKVPMYDTDDTHDILNGRPFASYDLSEQHNIVKNAKQEYQETINRLRNKPEVQQTEEQKI